MSKTRLVGLPLVAQLACCGATVLLAAAAQTAPDSAQSETDRPIALDAKATTVPLELLPCDGWTSQPQAILVWEWNSAFFGGETLTRTYKVLNETRAERVLTVDWELAVEGQHVAKGSKTHRVPGGEALVDTLRVELPAVEVVDRRDGTLDVTLREDGKAVFSDRKPVCLLRRTQAWPGTPPRALAVFDPQGGVRDWLEARRVVRKWVGGSDDFYTSVRRPEDVPEDARVLLVGAQALTAENRDAWARFIRRFVVGGASVIVLEQAQPLVGNELPVPGIVAAVAQPPRPDARTFAQPGGAGARTAFPKVPAHPVFRHLTAREFLTWRGDGVVCRAAYATPRTGAVCLAQAGGDPEHSAVLEIALGHGRILLSQFDIGAKLGTEPVADRLLRNLLAWAAERAADEVQRAAGLPELRNEGPR